MTYIARHVKAQLLQTILEAFTGYAMNLIQRKLGVFSAERNAASLDLENNLVEISLGRCKLAVDWPGTRNVGDVAPVFLLRVIRMNIVTARIGLLTPPASTRTISPSLREEHVSNSRFGKSKTSRVRTLRHCRS